MSQRDRAAAGPPGPSMAAGAPGRHGGWAGPGGMAPLQTWVLQSLKNSEQECLQLKQLRPWGWRRKRERGSQGALPTHCQAGPRSQDPERWADQIPRLGGASGSVLVWKVTSKHIFYHVRHRKCW